MEYNNYYPGQPGHPPPPVNNHQQIQQQQQQPPPGGQMMHAPMPPQNIRQAMPPGPPGHHQQIQIQQHLGHHSQQMPPQQHHPSYHQIQAPHPHGQPVPHSGSPHPQQPQQQQQQHNNHHQPGPPPHQQSGLPQQHHMHPQSPHSHNGPPMHMQQQPQMNQMIRPTMGPSVLNHQQPGLQQPPHHHQNFFSGGAITHSNPHHYPQQNQHQPHHQPQHHQQQQQHHHHHHQPQLIHHPPPPITHHPHLQQSIGRISPGPTICQTEFRIIELNRWLQSRPISRHPISPQPNSYLFDESRWWEKFAFEFFEDDATLTLRIQDDKPAEYTIGRTLIPRFFRTYFDGGVTDLSFNLRNPKESYMHPHPQSLITLDCDQAFIVSIFRHPSGAANPGVVVHTEGHLILDFVCNNYDNLSIKSWKFFTKGCREYIDRSMTAMGPNVYLAEPITRQGLTKSTISYLKMCMIMEPMQDLMLQNRQTRMDPRSCLRKYLYDRFKISSTTDNRAGTKSRRKRKSSAAPPITGPAAQTTTKKTKVNLNNPIGNNSGLNNNLNMSPSGIPSFSLASQDVMVVGEPSMMGGDFGDDNERMITRLENTQYDPTASTPSNAEESDSMNASVVDGNTSSNGNNLDQIVENHTMSPSILQQRQQQQQQQQQQRASPLQAPQEPAISQQNQMEQTSPHLIEAQQQQQVQQQQQPQQQLQQTQHLQQQAQQLPMSIQDQSQEVSVTDHMNQVNLIDHLDIHTQNEADQQQLTQSTNEHQDESEQQMPQEDSLDEEFAKHQQEPVHEETTVNSVTETPDDSNLILGVNSIDHIENHTGSIQPLNDESNSNSQLPCATASTTNSTMEQQQPVDNGVA